MRQNDEIRTYASHQVLNAGEDFRDDRTTILPARAAVGELRESSAENLVLFDSHCVVTVVVRLTNY